MSNIRTGGFIGIENKFLDTDLSDTAITGAWSALNPTGTGSTDTISVPAEGTGESQRVGRMYTIDSVMVRGVIKTAAFEAQVAPYADFRARVIVYWDTQTNGAEATATQIMDAGGTDEALAFRNLQFTKRFIVLFDKVILFNLNNQVNEGAVNSFAIGARERTFSFYKRFSKGVQVQCDATTANVSSVTDNNFGVAAVVSSTAMTPTIGYQARIRFRG